MQMRMWETEQIECEKDIETRFGNKDETKHRTLK